MKNKHIFFLCSGTDFHAYDWFKSAKKFNSGKEVEVISDMMYSENQNFYFSDVKYFSKLFIIDSILFHHHSKYGHIWRNIVKLFLIPFQVALLLIKFKSIPKHMVFCHSMYYVWLAYIARLNYIAIPQGSDILLKPNQSIIYKFLTIKSLKSAHAVSVDSSKMVSAVKNLSGVNSLLIQNGVDVKLISKMSKTSYERNFYTYARGLTPLYQIRHLLEARCKISTKLPLKICFPFSDDNYYNECIDFFHSYDDILGKLDKSDLIQLFLKSKIVFSIPLSDSSPRTVYEAIFCGAIVVTTYHQFVDSLSEEMKSRIIITDLKDDMWLDRVISRYDDLAHCYNPSHNDLVKFDQDLSFSNLISAIN